MLDVFTIATKGGVVLWSKTFSTLSSDPVNGFIQKVLIQNARTEQNRYTTEQHHVHWLLANDLGLIFVVAYQKILQLSYIAELLERVKARFEAMYSDRLTKIQHRKIPGTGNSRQEGNTEDNQTLLEFGGFDDIFENVLYSVEKRNSKSKHNRGTQPRRFEDTEKYQQTREGSQKELEALAADSSGIHAMPRRRGKQMRTWADKKQKAKADSNAEGKKKGKKGKEMRVWDESKATSEQMRELDYSIHDSNHVDGSDAGDAASAVAQQWVDKASMGTATKDGGYEVANIEDEDEDDSDYNDAERPSKPAGFITTFLQTITVGKTLTEADLAGPLASMREHLIQKNVAANIATEICQSVQHDLVGQRISGLQTIKSQVRQSMYKVLTRVLTPQTSIDILRGIGAARSEGRPYTVVFVGVNGVGKSTNLSKVCFWLLQNKLRVLVAACDTFRSGAVEQLRVHVRNLQCLSPSSSLSSPPDANKDRIAGVDLFERGYGKDSAAIARDAIQYAKARGYDVVLIDTAGRMQDNEPLMRALAKLIGMNDPDKIVFVGEALVGNEAVDQLTKFNKALREFTHTHRPRHIDGMILTKFDTIDDKVGAALSMTYITGQPILFVGTGQTYTDLKTMRVSNIVNSLLRN